MLKQTQTLKQTQKLVMTVQLRQAIKLLQLNRTELIEEIQGELEKNPVLEESEPGDSGNSETPESNENFGEQSALDNSNDYSEAIGSSDDSLQELAPPEQSNVQDFDWEVYFQNVDSYNRNEYMDEVNHARDRDELPSYEQTLSSTVSLRDHLLFQLSMQEAQDDLEREIAETLIGNIAEDGYLITRSSDGKIHGSAEEIIAHIAEEFDVSTEKVEDVLVWIQEFDPPGVGARNLRECLLIQLAHSDIDNPVVSSLIDQFLPELEKMNIKKIEKSLGVDKMEIKAALDIIKTLDPKPGFKFSSGSSDYIIPDIFVDKTEDGFHIRQNDEGLPMLKINNYYRKKMLSTDQESKKYIVEQLNSAKNLIKSIHQRQRTIYRVADCILRRQKEFFEHGKQSLKPMILKDVAQDIGMHESTISRVTTNKYMYTPHGTFELKYFFNSSLSTSSGDDVATETVREKIKEVIENEDPRKPLSDQRISELLKGMFGINVARRTVAKYRESMRIGAAFERKERF